jgi:ADP-ribosyl-[dinitrogen reductase] hydrolase
LHCVQATAGFEEAVVKVVNGGDDADTVGAVTGEIAGALYGLSAIPDRWLKVLQDREKFIELATQLFEIGER